MSGEVWLWIGFNLFVLAMLALDLGVFHRRSHQVTLREALVWSGVWILLALLFNLGVYFWRGQEAALQFLTGYLIEKSLSVDNIFVFLLIFSYFRVPPEYQRKVLLIGVVTALVLRALLILAGAALLERFHWVIYLFGGFLVLSGIRFVLEKEQRIEPEANPLVRLFRRFMPVTGEYHEDRLFVRREGRLWATPLFVTLLTVEFTDLVFAVDSIPAIFAVTNDPFIVYTSNVFAILGLRSLFFALAGFMDRFSYLKFGLAAVLVFVGLKMLLADVMKIPIGVSLGVIAALLAAAVIASLLRPPREADGSAAEPANRDRRTSSPVE